MSWLYFIFGLAVLIVAAPITAKFLFVPARLADAPWWEQARGLYLLRLFHSYFVLLAVLVTIVGLDLPALQTGLPYHWNILAAVFALLVSLIACRSNFKGALRLLKHPGKGGSSSFSVVFVVLSGFILTVVASFFVPPVLGLRTALIIGGAMVLLFAWNWWFATGILRLFGGIRDASPELTHCVNAAARELNFSAPVKVWEIKSGMLNALAFQMHGAVGFTLPLLDALSEDEIRTIAKHELAHLAESNQVQALRRMSPVCFFPLLFISPLSSTGFFWVPLLIMILLLQAYKIVQRRMEERADQQAGSDSGLERENQVYAGALYKLYKGNLMPVVMSGKQTHPDLYDRMEVLGAVPDFPRPNPPQRIWPFLLVVGWGCGMALLGMAFWLVPGG